MARAKTYLVPIDFSRASEKAFDHALAMARESGAKLAALHVLPAEMVYPPTGGSFDFYAMLERDAREKFNKLVQRKKVDAKECQLVLGRGTDFADVVVQQSKKLKASMIIMGSHGRTGLRRLLLGSVAERTLRYADCPVLIVK